MIKFRVAKIVFQTNPFSDFHCFSLLRASIEKAMAAKEKESQEQKLRLIAQRAREERSGIIKGLPTEQQSQQLSEF